MHCLRLDGIIEIRMDFGKGYRLYCAEEGQVLVVLLAGGDKTTQDKDIKKALEYWRDYHEKRKFRTYDEAMIEHYKQRPDELKGYVSVALSEYQKDGDEKAFL